MGGVELEIQLTQPAGAGVWAELGKNQGKSGKIRENQGKSGKIRGNQGNVG